MYKKTLTMTIIAALFCISAPLAGENGNNKPLHVGQIGNPTLKLKKDPREGKGFREVPKDFGKLKTRPWRCPHCGHIVDVPMEKSKTRNVDADLCPHPLVGVKFRSDIVCCPKCGFAALKEHFMKIKNKDFTMKEHLFIQNKLTPNINKAEKELLNVNLQKISVKNRIDIHSIFTQEDIPDVIRCAHALNYYTFITKDNPTRSNKSIPLRAKLAMLTAWAYRREVSGPINAAIAMKSVRRILEKVEKHTVGDKGVQKRSEVMLNMLRDRIGLKFIDEQTILIMLAGDYERLGYRQWAEDCLMKVMENTKPGTEERWLDDTTGSMQQRRNEANRRRSIYNNLAQIRMAQIQREMDYLMHAAALMREGLQKKSWIKSPRMIREKMYLIAECERRFGNFTRARLWYNAVGKLSAEAVEKGAEIYAPQQLIVLNKYSKSPGIRQFPYRETDPTKIEENNQTRFAAVAADSKLLGSIKSDIEYANVKREIESGAGEIRTSAPPSDNSVPKKNTVNNGPSTLPELPQIVE